MVEGVKTSLPLMCDLIYPRWVRVFWVHVYPKVIRQRKVPHHTLYVHILPGIPIYHT